MSILSQVVLSILAGVLFFFVGILFINGTLDAIEKAIRRATRDKKCRHRYVRCVYPRGGKPRVECVECGFKYKMGS